MTRYRWRRIVFFMARLSLALRLLGLGLAAIAASAQDAPQPPAISVATRLVQVGVIVRDKNGPVADLTKDDFILLDRGKTQKISVFSAESGASGPPAPPAQPLPPNTFSDLPQYGSHRPRSVTIVLLDNLNTLSGSTPQPYETTPYWIEDHALANAKQHLLDFLKQLDPGDRLAIYGLADSLHVLCDFACDRDQLVAVVGKYDATSNTQREEAEPGSVRTLQGRDFNEHIAADLQSLAALKNQGRAEATMAALTAIADHVADLPGRKNLLWLTANLPFSGQAIARILGRANIAAYPVDARGLLPRSPTVSPEAGSNIGDAYVRGALGMNDTPAETDDPIGVDAMQKMAEETGGRAFVNTNDLTGAIRDAVEDSAVTYTLGFYIGADSLDGKFHELKVQVRREGLTTRYPKGYFAIRDAPPTKDQNWQMLVTAVHSPVESSVIPLQAKVVRINQPLPNSLRLTCSIDIHHLQLVQIGNLHQGSISVYVIGQDRVGKVLSQWSKTYQLQLSAQQHAALLKSGLPFNQDVQPKAGVTTLRILIEDPDTAEIGSLIIPLSQVK